MPFWPREHTDVRARRRSLTRQNAVPFLDSIPGRVRLVAARMRASGAASGRSRPPPFPFRALLTAHKPLSCNDLDHIITPCQRRRFAYVASAWHHQPATFSAHARALCTNRTPPTNTRPLSRMTPGPPSEPSDTASRTGPGIAGTQHSRRLRRCSPLRHWCRSRSRRWRRRRSPRLPAWAFDFGRRGDERALIRTTECPNRCWRSSSPPSSGRPFIKRA